jgi:sulfite exporter TauE/SafE
MLTLLWFVFVASLLGSLHCAGMCGGFVAFYAGHTPGGARRMASHLAYSGGRFLVYALMGLVAGIVGAALDLAGSVAGLQRVAAVAAGVVILIWGLVALLRVRGLEVFQTVLPAPVQRLASSALAGLADCPPVLRALVIGLLTTFLPCGWLYAFVVAAAGTGSALGGLLVMIAFWAGTVPILLALGIGVHLLAPRIARRLPAITATALLVVGLVLVFGRVERIGMELGKDHPGTLEESLRYVKKIDHEEAPCCADPATPPAPGEEPASPDPAPTRTEKPPCCNDHPEGTR